MTKKIYKLTQNDNKGHNTYNAMIVIAENENQARIMFPHDNQLNKEYDFKQFHNWESLRYWANCPENVNVEYLGQAPKLSVSRIVLASFNAG